VLGFGYAAAGRRNTITLPNSIIGTYGFDNADQLTSITYMNGATIVGTLGYGYDLGGRRTSIAGTLAGFVAPTAVSSLTYDGTNRLTSWAGTPLTYDASGNLTAFGSATYTWNARNQLIATSGGGATFGYDALGRRVSATVSGITTPYLYDGQNPAMISANQMLAGPGLDEIYAQINSSGTTSYLRDGLNSTVALTNSSAARTANYSYSPYGDSAGSGTITTPLQYTGSENDGATGLYSYRARYYSPQLGRFISEDPIGLDGGTNYYAYADGDPISETDPEGEFGIIGAVVGAGIDVALQTLVEGKSFRCISCGQVGIAGALGALGGAGLGGELLQVTRGSWKWANVGRRIRRVNNIAPTQDLHHWAIERGSALGKILPDEIVNSPLNLNAIDRALHQQIHNEFDALERWWAGTPSWGKAAEVSLGAGAVGQMASPGCGCN
jgi:RHS repeat-associated protein